MKQSVCVIIGAPRVLNRKLAVPLAEKGCHIILIVDKDAPKSKYNYHITKDVVKIGSTMGHCTESFCIRCNLKDTAAIKSVLNSIKDQFGLADVIIYDFTDLIIQQIKSNL